MLKLITLCVAFAFSQFLFSQEINFKDLKVKQPNWRPVIVESHASGTPAIIIYYEPQPGTGKDTPVKKQSFYEDGTILSETDLISHGDQAVPHGPSLTYYQSKAVETIAFYDHGKIDHESKTFDESGRPIKLETFKAGVRHGRLETYYPNGAKASQCFYGNGVLEGELTEWYEEGTLKTKKYFVVGLLHGQKDKPALTRYYPNTRIAEVMDFRNGRPYGIHLKYHQNGVASYRLPYKNGLKHGMEKVFDEAGKLVGKGAFCRGKPIKKHEFSHPNGVVAYVAHYDAKGKLQRPIVEYDLSGNKMLEYGQMNHQFHDQLMEYFPNGQLRRRYHYDQGTFHGIQEDYFDDGSQKTSAEYSHGKRHGRFREWNEKGELIHESCFQNGLREGAYLLWYEGGSPKLEACYRAGKLHGLKKEWNVEGVLTFEAVYADDVPVGELKEYHDNGKLKRVANFYEGRPHGKEELFYDNGRDKGRWEFVEGTLHGDFMLWTEDGQLEVEQHYHQGVPVGIHKDYYSGNGQVKSISCYLKGALDGEQTRYYPSGIKQAVITYEEGVLHGKKIFWDENGDIVEEAEYNKGNLDGRYYLLKLDGSEIIFHYKDNLRHGLHQMFYAPDDFFGKVKAAEGNYVNGFLEGELVEFNEAGNKISSLFYKKGVKEGIGTTYMHDGKIESAVEFHLDKRNGMAYEYFANGNVHKQVNFVDDLKEGEEKTFFENEKLASSYVYKNGQLHGKCCEWNRKDVLVFEGEFVDGVKHGIFNRYDENGKPKLLQTYSNGELTKKWKAEPAEVVPEL